MSGQGVAYRSSHHEVVAAWEQYKADTDSVTDKRNEMIARFGRSLIVNRSGFGHGTRVIGFSKLDGERPGDVIGEDGELRIHKSGWRAGTAAPNLRRKAGQALEAELNGLTSTGPTLPGMPAFCLVGLRALSPGIAEHNGVLWVRWADQPNPEPDVLLWESVPLSVYYAAQEAMEASA